MIIGRSHPVAFAQFRPSTNLSVSVGPTAPQSGIFDMSVDAESNLQGVFDKPSATQIRALQPMHARITFGTSVIGNVVNSGFDIYIRRGGTRVPHGVAGGRARNRAAEPFDACMQIKLQLDANDVIDLEMVNLEKTNTLTAVAARTVLLVEVMEYI